MDLHSGTPLWRVVNPQPAVSPALDHNATCEVAIVGGGITGALVAYDLVRAGADLILINKRQFGAGSTSSSTGLLQYEIDTPLIDLIPKVGKSRGTVSKCYALDCGGNGITFGMIAARLLSDLMLGRPNEVKVSLDRPSCHGRACNAAVRSVVKMRGVSYALRRRWACMKP